MEEQSEGRDKAGRFLPKNEFWKARASCGVSPKFAGPEELWASCVEYFEWNEANPLYEMRPFAYQGVVIQEPVAKMRAMTLSGLCHFIGISQETWRNWRSEGDYHRADLLGVIREAEEIIRRQKFEGASADLLNANIIARDLGLADKAEFTGKDGADLVPKPEPTPTEVARQIAFILREAMQEQTK